MKNSEDKKTCTCMDDCTCGCKDGKDCTCDVKEETCSCSEGESCTCGEECDSDEGCHCGDGCTCKDEKESDCNCEDECSHVELSKNDKKDKKKEEKEKKNKYKKEIEELKGRVKELENKVLTEKAELINYRKRKDDEVHYMLKYASEDMVKEILPIVDNFERAIKLDNDDNLEDELSKFLSGFKMIYCHLVKVLEENGVKAIDGDSKAFDPTYHEGVLTEPREGIEAGMVLEVMQKGYLLKDKVIRPAMVKVSE